MKAIGQLFVSDPEELEDGGMQVMNLDRIFSDVVTDFICRGS